jgi:hypothetical protein
MCNCKPKHVEIGKIDDDGYATETCKHCGEQRTIPASQKAIQLYCEQNKILTRSQYSAVQAPAIMPYDRRTRSQRTLVEHINNSRVLDY